MMEHQGEAPSLSEEFTMERKRRNTYSFEIARRASLITDITKHYFPHRDVSGLVKTSSTTEAESQVDDEEEINDSPRMPLLIAPRFRSYSDATGGAAVREFQSCYTFNTEDHGSIVSSLVEGQKLIMSSLVHLSFQASYHNHFQADSYNVESSASHLSWKSESMDVEDVQRSDLYDVLEKRPKDRGASVLLAIWNILPLLQGSSIFSMPYAVAVGGYVILPAIVFVSFLAHVTGGILIDCLYETSPKSKSKKRVRLDYVEIARSVWGDRGARIISLILVFYLITGASVNILLIGKSVHSFLKQYTRLSFVILTSMCSLVCYPTLFIRRLTTIAYLSMLSLASILLGIMAVICVFVMNKDRWSANSSLIYFVHGEGLPLALSIVLFSCMSHTVLPQIEGTMAEPSKFPQAIRTSYCISSLMKSLVGILGILTYGVPAQSLITLNVSEFNVAATIVCSLALAGFGMFNYPLNLFVVGNTCDSFVENTRFSQNGPFYLIWLASTRLVLTVISVVAALALPYFGIVLAFRGSLIGTCLIFVFPCYFQLRLKWERLTKLQTARNITLILVGIAMGLAGLFSSVDRFVKAIQGNQYNS